MSKITNYAVYNSEGTFIRSFFNKAQAEAYAAARPGCTVQPRKLKV